MLICKNCVIRDRFPETIAGNSVGRKRKISEVSTGPALMTFRLNFNIMKIKTIIVALTLGGLTLLSGKAFAQEESEMTRTEHQVYDSLQTAKHDQELIREQKENDAERMTEAKDAQVLTKANAKETRRVDREASLAAREAKMALKAERRAQKARKDADKQARKAVKAKKASDRN